jgi:hypothetical protein
MEKIEEHLLEGPSFIFLFHPGLGPLYSIITQKLRKGHIFPGSELQLEVAEADIENLSLDGSLIIQSLSPLGNYDASHILHYGQESKCMLRNVTIQNKGIDRSVAQQYWKNAITRKEELRIILHEGAEFHAEDILLKGSHTFEVPAHHRLVLLAEPKKGKWKVELSPINKPTWYWRYSFDANNAIQLKKVKTRNNSKITMDVSS